MNFPDILAHHTDSDQLDTAEKVNWQHGRHPTGHALNSPSQAVIRIHEPRAAATPDTNNESAPINRSGITENEVMVSTAKANIFRSGYFDSPPKRA
jgi:hypothetical protein